MKRGKFLELMKKVWNYITDLFRKFINLLVALKNKIKGKKTKGSDSGDDKSHEKGVHAESYASVLDEIKSKLESDKKNILKLADMTLNALSGSEIGEYADLSVERKNFSNSLVKIYGPSDAKRVNMNDTIMKDIDFIKSESEQIFNMCNSIQSKISSTSEDAKYEDIVKLANHFNKECIIFLAKYDKVAHLLTSAIINESSDVSSVDLRLEMIREGYQMTSTASLLME